MTTPGSTQHDRNAFDAFVRRLLIAEWEQPDCPMRLNANLQLADLAGSEFFANARLFLATLATENGTAATATGNLNRAFVIRMFDRLVLSKSYRDFHLHICKVFNERKVWPLHLARVVSACAGLAGC